MSFNMIRQALFRTFMRGMETPAKGCVVGSEIGQVGIYSQGAEWEAVDEKLPRIIKGNSLLKLPNRTLAEVRPG